MKDENVCVGLNPNNRESRKNAMVMYTHLTVKTCCLDPESLFENSDPLDPDTDPHQNPVDPYDWIPRAKIQT